MALTPTRRIVWAALAFISAFLFLNAPARGAYLINVPQVLRQPNGDILKCLASGDEYYNWLHDASGFTIVQDPKTGWYVYAEADTSGGLKPSSLIAGKADPFTAGLVKGLRFAPEKILEIRNGMRALPSGTDNAMAPRTGTLNNLVVFIRFSGESEFTDSPSVFTGMLNSTGASDNSMYHYFQEASYADLSVQSTLYPPPSTTIISYQDSQPRGYYQPSSATNPSGYTGGNNGADRTNREFALLKNAVAAVAGYVPSGLVIDGDADGYVDNIIFVVTGSPTGWNSILWPHQWSLYTTPYAYINGKRVGTFNLQLRDYLVNYRDVGVLCHEMFHSLGSPDLYHYTDNGIDPVGAWDLMENDQNPPQHMGAYMKRQYGGWIDDVPQITTSGTYTLNPLTSASGNCYKIASPNSTTEYFLVEYRRKTGIFEASLPGEGLLVYRINTAEYGNAEGPPDEVYIYRPSGTPTANGTINSAAFSSGAGRTAINDATDPSCFLTAGGAGGLNISNVGAAGTTISFYVTLPTGSRPTIGLSKTSYYFGAEQYGVSTPSETVVISNTGIGTLNWTATSSASWLSVSPRSGTGAGVMTISIVDTNLAAGTYQGTITVSDPNATNSPRTITVILSVGTAGSDSPPFGNFATPNDGSTVVSSIPVTGWALDDIGMQSVKIYRGSSSNRIYIGEASFVRGARPDVETAYPTYPQNDRAGWGYMLLTNMLPNGGNGTFTLLAYATDITGHEVLLGEKTITCDNAHAVNPFGAIDTPAQGGTAAGNAFVSFGWALTPPPNSIATDGSTIGLYVDGASLGHPVYNNYRSDIASLFPGYANSNGAVGYYYLNTTGYADGVHTIAWSVTDSAGNVDGIGSRYFTIQNSAGVSNLNGTGSGAWRSNARGNTSVRSSSEIASIPEDPQPVCVKRGWGTGRPTETVFPEADGLIRMTIPETSRVVVHLNDVKTKEKPSSGTSGYEAYELVLGELRPLPIGASFDVRTGVLSWQPGPGFRGEYQFVIVDSETMTRKTIKITIGDGSGTGR